MSVVCVPIKKRELFFGMVDDGRRKGEAERERGRGGKGGGTGETYNGDDFILYCLIQGYYVEEAGDV